MTPTHTPHCSHGLACALACASHLACLEGLPWETCMSRTAHRVCTGSGSQLWAAAPEGGRALHPGASALPSAEGRGAP